MRTGSCILSEHPPCKNTHAGDHGVSRTRVSQVLVPPSSYLPAENVFILQIKGMKRVKVTWNCSVLVFFGFPIPLVTLTCFVFGDGFTREISPAFLKTYFPRNKAREWFLLMLGWHRLRACANTSKWASFYFHLPQFNSINYKRLDSFFPFLFQKLFLIQSELESLGQWLIPLFLNVRPKSKTGWNELIIFSCKFSQILLKMNYNVIWSCSFMLICIILFNTLQERLRHVYSYVVCLYFKLLYMKERDFPVSFGFCC